MNLQFSSLKCKRDMFGDQKGKKFNVKYIVRTVKQTPSLMVWAAMSKYGTAGLYFCPRHHNEWPKIYLAASGKAE